MNSCKRLITKGAEPPQRLPGRPPGRGGAGGDGVGVEMMTLMNQMMLEMKEMTLKKKMKQIQSQERTIFKNNYLQN